MALLFLFMSYLPIYDLVKWIHAFFYLFIIFYKLKLYINAQFPTVEDPFVVQHRKLI